MKKRKKEQIEDTFTATSAKPLLTPMDVQQKEFRVSRMGGYKMRDVDEFLDEITTAMSALVEENRRLKDQAGSGAMMGAPDLEEVSRQADEIIRRAREEAALIVRDTHAAAGVAAGAGVGEGDRAAISPFLLREREFLQSLAGLVQGHAEAVKGMAKDARGKAAASPAASSEAPEPAAAPAIRPGSAATEAPAAPEGELPAPEPPAAEDEAPAAADARSTAPEPLSVPEPEPRTDQPTEAMEGPVRVEEPEPVTAGRLDQEDAAPQEGDRSLRELFWGED